MRIVLSILATFSAMYLLLLSSHVHSSEDIATVVKCITTFALSVSSLVLLSLGAFIYSANWPSKSW